MLSNLEVPTVAVVSWKSNQQAGRVGRQGQSSRAAHGLTQVQQRKLVTNKITPAAGVQRSDDLQARECIKLLGHGLVV